MKDALTLMQDIVGESDNMVGGTEQALADRDAGVRRQRVQRLAEGGDGRHRRLRPGAGPRTRLEPETGYNVFTFPSINDSAPVVVGSGDICRQVQGEPGRDAFLEYLTTPEPAEIWASRGGFSSPNKNLDPSMYPDEITRTTAGALAEAEASGSTCPTCSRPAFGGTPGAGAVQGVHGLRREPGRHRRDHAADGG